MCRNIRGVGPSNTFLDTSSNITQEMSMTSRSRLAPGNAIEMVCKSSTNADHILIKLYCIAGPDPKMAAGVGPVPGPPVFGQFV